MFAIGLDKTFHIQVFYYNKSYFLFFNSYFLIQDFICEAIIKDDYKTYNLVKLNSQLNALWMTYFKKCVLSLF